MTDKCEHCGAVRSDWNLCLLDDGRRACNPCCADLKALLLKEGFFVSDFARVAHNPICIEED